MLTYMLSQKIGIWYKDEEWKEKVFQDVVDHYPPTMIYKIIKSKNESVVDLIDGTTIRFVPTCTGMRGCCFSKVILQPGIDEKIIRSIIMPTLKHQNRNVMVLGEEGIGWI